MSALADRVEALADEHADLELFALAVKLRKREAALALMLDAGTIAMRHLSRMGDAPEICDSWHRARRGLDL